MNIFDGITEKFLREHFDACEKQAKKVETFLEQCRIRAVNDLIHPDRIVDGVGKDSILRALETAMPYRAHLKHFVEYMKKAAQYIAELGYNPKTVLAPFL